MLKKMSVILIMILLLLGLSEKVFAADKYNTTSTINGVTANWEYELNDSNEIENLKCTNASELSGNITIPGFLDEKTVVSVGSEAFKSATNITGVTVSDSIHSIEYGAFNGCNSLTSVDLGSVTKLSFDVFKNCTSLTSITIPKTLKEGAVSPCLNNQNITSITLEEGLTVVPSYLCANTGITEITIPSSVKEIDYKAFQDCSNLTNVDLGQLEKISFEVFENCPKLTNIKIPKTLKEGAVSPCLSNQNITSITLEEGLTVVPSYLCANTGITEITIPNSVTKIDYSAFDDCSNLKKITILDNVTEMGFYNIDSSESIFKNHNEDLTIYCYEGSMAANYAIKYNIKYVYLPRNASDTPSDESEPDTPKTDPSEPETTKPSTTSSTKQTEKDDTTIAKGGLPKTGVAMTGIFVVSVISLASIFFYKKYTNFKDI